MIKKTKKKKNHDEIALLAKNNLDCIKDLCRSLTESHIGPDYFNVIDFVKKIWLYEKRNQ